MMITAQYQEALTSGGVLKVMPSNWYIEYRFKPSTPPEDEVVVRLNGTEIEEYQLAWEENFKRYLELKDLIPPQGSFRVGGLKEMVIRIREGQEGVCLTAYDMPIQTQEALNQVIADYEYAKEIAIKIQQTLFRPQKSL